MNDEVDEIVAAWGRERDDLDVAPLHVLSRVSRLAAVLDQRRADAFVEHRLQGHEFDVLSVLRRSGEPFEQTAGDLAALTHVTSGTMTRKPSLIVSRSRGLRDSATPTLADGRLVRVRLTPGGRERVDAAFTALLESERELLATLDPAQRDELAAALRVLLLAAGPDDPLVARIL